METPLKDSFLLNNQDQVHESAKKINEIENLFKDYSEMPASSEKYLICLKYFLKRMLLDDFSNKKMGLKFPEINPKADSAENVYKFYKIIEIEISENF